MIKFKLDKRLLSPDLKGSYLLTYACIASHLTSNDPFTRLSREYIYRSIGNTSPSYADEALQYLEENGFLTVEVKGESGSRRYKYNINEPEDFVWASCEMFNLRIPPVYRIILFRFYSMINSERFSVTYNVRFSIEEFASTVGISIESAKLALLYLASRNILVPLGYDEYIYNEDSYTSFSYEYIRRRRIEGDCFEYECHLSDKYWGDMDDFISKLSFYRANNPNAYKEPDYNIYGKEDSEPYPVKDMKFINRIYNNKECASEETANKVKELVDRFSSNLIKLNSILEDLEELV